MTTLANSSFVMGINAPFFILLPPGRVFPWKIECMNLIFYALHVTCKKVTYIYGAQMRGALSKMKNSLKYRNFFT